MLGFTGYQPLMRSCIGQGLRKTSNTLKAPSCSDSRKASASTAFRRTHLRRRRRSRPEIRLTLRNKPPSSLFAGVIPEGNLRHGRETKSELEALRMEGEHENLPPSRCYAHGKTSKLRAKSRPQGIDLAVLFQNHRWCEMITFASYDPLGVDDITADDSVREENNDLPHQGSNPKPA